MSVHSGTAFSKSSLHLFTKHLAGEEANQSIPKCASQEASQEAYRKT